MAKEKVSLCPEHNEYVSGDARKITDRQQEAANFERTPVLNPALRWIIPPQENCAVKMNITGVGERISKRIWAAGLNADGNVESVRSISVASLRAMALGYVKEGVAAPEVSAVTNAEGNLRTAPGTSYIHAMDDTTFIKGENNFYVVKESVAIQPAGSAEVYQAKFEEGKMQAVDGKVALVTTTMKFFNLLSTPTEAEVAAATAAIKEAVEDQFYAL